MAIHAFTDEPSDAIEVVNAGGGDRRAAEGDDPGLKYMYGGRCKRDCAMREGDGDLSGMRALIDNRLGD